MKVLTFEDLPQRGIKHSKAQLYRLIKAGKFPKQIHLSENRVGFVETEIDAWLKSKIADRDRSAA
jgi:prophage regulatory protein